MSNSGGRFLERFAGSGDFQNRLNKSKRAPRDFRNAPGDFTRDGNTNEFSSTRTSQLSDVTGAQTTARNNKFFSSRQHSAENGVFKNYPVYSPTNDKVSKQGDIDGSEFVNRYAAVNRNLQHSKSDGSSIANKYVQNARNNQTFDVEAMDRQIRRAPLYHNAKSELEGLLTYGDKYRNSRENPVSWNNPTSPKAPDKPDFESIYNKTRDDIDDIDI
jgi:hypothetical protein